MKIIKVNGEDMDENDNVCVKGTGAYSIFQECTVRFFKKKMRKNYR